MADEMPTFGAPPDDVFRQDVSFARQLRDTGPVLMTPRRVLISPVDADLAERIYPRSPAMKPEERALLDDVIANPDDDTPRLIYADWLEDRGEEGDDWRASLIREQIAGKSSPGPAGFCSTMQWYPFSTIPSDVPNAHTWLKRSTSVARGSALVQFDDGQEHTVNWTRGFIEGIRIPSTFLKSDQHYRWLFQMHPVSRVEISDEKPYPHLFQDGTVYVFSTDLWVNIGWLIPDGLPGELNCFNWNSQTPESAVQTLSDYLVACGRYLASTP